MPLGSVGKLTGVLFGILITISFPAGVRETRGERVKLTCTDGTRRDEEGVKKL